MPDLMGLFATRTVRARAQRLLAHARAGKSAHWCVHDSALTSCADTVARVTRERYPDLNIPYHSRWRHFEAAGVNRRLWLDDVRAGASRDAAVLVDLVIVSVLLDAGAGAAWRYAEARTGETLARSEGLGVASFHAFAQGLFSSNPSDPLRCDAKALVALTPQALANAFAVREDNPLVGLEGRCALLQRLGSVLLSQPESFEYQQSFRASNWLYAGEFAQLFAMKKIVNAHQILDVVLRCLSRIWPSGSQFHGVALGDCWPHPALGDAATTDGWMPFHKLSQWLTYSLLEPLEWSGTQVLGLDALTGLPEYRNGGLLMDSGVLALRDAHAQARSYVPGDELVVEWRALTVALLDELHPLVAQRLGKTTAELPLACVLEGGTWAAGRVLAQAARGGLPPLTIESDGTVF
jgi:Protein of unknown function (DUF1688)